MRPLVALLPPILGGAALLLVGATTVSPRLRRVATRLGVALVGEWVARDRPRRDRQRRRMHAAHVRETHRAFAARTLFRAGAAGAGVAVVVGWLVATLLSAPARAPSLLDPVAGLVPVGAGLPATVGATVVAGGAAWAAAGVAVGRGQWLHLDQRATARANAIEASLPRTVAFLYALSRSGMSFTKVLETLTRNRQVYGEAAAEVGVAVRDMEAFGTDVLSSLQWIAGRTPSENMSEFSENLASVLASGQSVADFLRTQYERYQEEAEAQQEQYLELLSTFAEVYVTVFVAGPLFFVTVLVVIGLVISDTLPLLRVLAYLGIPLASAGFVVYIDSVSQADGGTAVDEDDAVGAGDLPVGASAEELTAGSAREVAGDGGVVDSARDRRNRRRLASYARIEPLRRWARDPVGALAARPELTAAVTVPAGLAWLALRRGDAVVERAGAVLAAVGRLGPGALAPGPDGVIAAVDGPLVEATLVALIAYAVVYEVGKRRRRSLEDAMPDLLDRMASVNEAGLTVVESLQRVGGTEVGPLEAEVERTARDVEWGADAATALRRLDRRTDVPAITRAVTLITNAMAASGDVAPVLRIAADEAEQSRRLRRTRRQQMLTYLMVIYVSFLVFLGIVGALTVSFIPAIEEAAAGTAAATGAGVSAGPFSGLTEVNTAAYELLFFHLSVIQAVCSGLVAGQLGEGSVRDGAKHAAILLGASYLAFAVVL